MESRYPIDDKAVNHLKKCPKMKFLIDTFGRLEERAILEDPFEGMISNIIYQQVSFASGNAIWERWQNKFKGIKPEEIISLEDSELKSCGLSNSKVKYVKELDKAIIEDGRRGSREDLLKMEIEEISDLFISIKGIGPWSIQMFLIFTLGLEDVRSYGDLALRKGVEWLFDEMDISEERYIELTDVYSPYNTIASFYLWEITIQKLIKKYSGVEEYKNISSSNKRS